MEVTEQRKVVQLSSPTTSSFSVSTYNILADCNMESDWYAIHTVLNTSQLSIMKCEIDLGGMRKTSMYLILPSYPYSNLNKSANERQCLHIPL